MDKRYKVIFFNLIKEKDYFKRQMLRFGVSEDISEDIITKAPVTLKKNLSLGAARRYADALIESGGRVTIHVEDNSDDSTQNGSTGLFTLKHFIMCPQCGQKQVRSETCIKCGLMF
jgi:predicted RNA-binding Zn-ribbon protein involved in translation (DUF1610 family)